MATEHDVFLNRLDEMPFAKVMLGRDYGTAARMVVPGEAVSTIGQFIIDIEAQGSCDGFVRPEPICDMAGLPAHTHWLHAVYELILMAGDAFDIEGKRAGLVLTPGYGGGSFHFDNPDYNDTCVRLGVADMMDNDKQFLEHVPDDAFVDTIYWLFHCQRHMWQYVVFGQRPYRDETEKQIMSCMFIVKAFPEFYEASYHIDAMELDARIYGIGMCFMYMSMWHPEIDAGACLCHNINRNRALYGIEGEVTSVGQALLLLDKSLHTEHPAIKVPWLDGDSEVNG